MEIKLSSNWTNLGLYGGSAILVIVVPFLIAVLGKQEFHMGWVVVCLVVFLYLGFIIYQFIYVCDARVVGNKILMKKKFRPAKSYTFDQIADTSVFHLRRTKYVHVNMGNADASAEKYLIVNATSIVSFEDKDAEEVLIRLREEAQSNRDFAI